MLIAEFEIHPVCFLEEMYRIYTNKFYSKVHQKSLQKKKFEEILYWKLNKGLE